MIAAWVITAETEKHRIFAFQSLPFCPDHKLYALCPGAALLLGVLSSAVHTEWAPRAGGKHPRPMALAELEGVFTARGRWRERLPIILDTLEALGRARRVDDSPSRWQSA